MWAVVSSARCTVDELVVNTVFVREAGRCIVPVAYQDRCCWSGTGVQAGTEAAIGTLAVADIAVEPGIVVGEQHSSRARTTRGGIVRLQGLCLRSCTVVVVHEQERCTVGEHCIAAVCSQVSCIWDPECIQEWAQPVAVQ